MKPLLTIFGSAALLLASFCSQAEIAIIVNPGVADSFDQSTLAKIFLGKTKKFPSGGSVIPINLPEENASRKTFDTAVLKKTAQQVKSYWSKQVFTGKGKPPREESNDAEVITLVKDNPNIIGYVDAAAVTDEVKVVATF